MQHRHLRWAAIPLAVALGASMASAEHPALGARPTAPSPPASASASASPSLATRHFALEVLASGDNLQQPFAIIDKRTALLSIDGAGGQLLGRSTVLLGSVLGDHSVAGVGERAQTGSSQPGDATTPAGVGRLCGGTGGVLRIKRATAAGPSSWRGLSAARAR